MHISNSCFDQLGLLFIALLDTLVHVKCITNRYMKATILKKRISVAAPVYCTAVLEYLCAELMELAGNAARDNKKQRINPRHILLAIANDEELHRVSLSLEGDVVLM